METTDKTFKEEGLLFTGKIKKHKLVSAIVFLLPVVLAVFFSYRDFPTYKTKMLVRMNVFSNFEMNYFYKSFQDLLNAKDYATVTERFFVDKKYAAMIKKISIEKIKDKPDVFVVNLLCKNTSCIKPVEAGIIKFMDDMADKNEKNKYRKNALSAQLDTINSQIKTMDALVLAIRSNKGIATEVYPFYAASATMSLVQLYDKRIDLTEKLNNSKGFSVMDSFIIPLKPLPLDMSKYLAIGILLGVVCCFFVVKEFLR